MTVITTYRVVGMLGDPLGDFDEYWDAVRCAAQRSGRDVIETSSDRPVAWTFPPLPGTYDELTYRAYLERRQAARVG